MGGSVDDDDDDCITMHATPSILCQPKQSEDDSSIIPVDIPHLYMHTISVYAAHGYQ
jgi:hypothetical protein